MSGLIIVGAQWGDEGKGKVVDLLAEKFDIVARFQGGHNAGHTVEVGSKKFILQLIPCGLLRAGKLAVIGNGVVVDPAALLREIDMLAEAGVSIDGRLFLSSRAHVIFPYHRALEKQWESCSQRQSIGTTSRGIGPAYEDKSGRRGIRVGDLLDESAFRSLVEISVREKQSIIRAWGGDLAADPVAMADEYLALFPRLRPYVADTAIFLNRQMSQGRSVLFEGAQGTMLDLDHGTYPYVTSSSATAGGACTGLGVPPTRVTGIAGVSKAYTTRVGGGPFPTEATGPEGDLLRERGREYGAVTGRSRRCGWLDLPVLRYSAAINGLDSLIVTKLDILDTLDEIPVCVAYELDGARLDAVPAQTDALARVRPVYQTFPGWKQSTFGLTRQEDLPRQARSYLDFISSQTGVEISLISTGPERNQTVVLPGTRLQKLLREPLAL